MKLGSSWGSKDLAVALETVITLIRWFEQVTEAVDNRWWNQIFVLITMPFTVWLWVVAAAPPVRPLAT